MFGFVFTNINPNLLHNLNSLIQSLLPYVEKEKYWVKCSVEMGVQFENNKEWRDLNGNHCKYSQI